LLDHALTRLWLEQVAIGAALSGASADVRAALQDNIESHGRESQHRLATHVSRPSEKPMPPHKYKAGQDVYFSPPKGAVQVASQRYRILRLLPLESGEVRYRIKSTAEHFERVAKESELSRSQQDSR
jgi:hypothetical protein